MIYPKSVFDDAGPSRVIGLWSSADVLREPWDANVSHRMSRRSGA